jgi:hypothetical protein
VARAGTLIKAAFDDFGSRASEWAGWAQQAQLGYSTTPSIAAIKNNSGRSVQPHKRYFLTCAPVQNKQLNSAVAA